MKTDATCPRTLLAPCPTRVLERSGREDQIFQPVRLVRREELIVPCLSTAALLSLQRFPNKANAKNWLFGLVQQFHLPFVILFEITGNTADKIAADIGQLLPSGIMIWQCDTAASRAGKTAIWNAEEIERHREKPMLRPNAPSKNDSRSVSVADSLLCAYNH
jgi:hypothetical protein